MSERAHRGVSRSSNVLCRIAAIGLLTIATGCSNDDVELLEVTGTVQMDGQPLPEATIRFLPIVTGEEPARPSSAVTDEEGYYELGYSTTKQGARPGDYRVYISSFRNPQPGMPGKPETVPLVYNKETTLTAEVTPDQTEFNFDIESDAGDVVQPRF